MKQLLLLALLFFPIYAQESLVPSPDVPWRAAQVEEPWGYHTIINLKECNPDLIRDKNYIMAYVYSLCALIDMKRFGECHVVHFGAEERVAGYSMFQLIETSNISGHFANESNSAYIDIFSCKKYDVEKAVRFTKEAFISKLAKFKVIER